MNFLKWLWKHLFIIIIATVVTIFMGYLAIRWIRYNDTYLYRYLFQDSNGKFAWTGFTAIIAIITLAINAWDNRRKFKADLISKSRIAWIENVREKVAQLNTKLSEINYLVSLYEISSKRVEKVTSRKEWVAFNNNYELELENMDPIEKRLTDSYEFEKEFARNEPFHEEFLEIESEAEDIRKKLLLRCDECIALNNNIELYFLGSNSEDINIKEGLNKLCGSLKYILKLINKDSNRKTVTHISTSSEDVKNINDDIERYLKAEWERAKKGE
ncbi:MULTISPECIES: hypothetical protein [Pediococcus]|uniref:hypothetical protein n=1 Tax=Pediococcus TaxID=1253 RepID=UPI00114DFC00|nr:MULTISPECIES: hypothetical protein [Pediococcus]KAF5440912.1 hypothetical protein HFC69_01300 [Pediococcus sp. EKM202D]KAF5441525.1 hypothetical protein HFC68_01580 [Pediococcus sp. EKM201D]QDJ24165.1 hypothetical protein CPU08_04050 [Pediococcus pentosaceus]